MRLTTMKICTDITLELPASWHELSLKDAEMLFRLLSSDIPEAKIPALAMLGLSDCRVLGRNGEGTWLLCSKDGELCQATAVAVAKAAESMAWVLEVPPTPYRPEWPGRLTPVATDFSNLTFEQFLIIDNIYQGSIQTKNIRLLERVRGILYPKSRKPFKEWQLYAMMQWIVSAKQFLAARYNEFFAPQSGESSSVVTPDKLREATDAQIRALTKGDICKEKEVLAMPLHRALAELNAQAREYREIKNMSKK